MAINNQQSTFFYGEKEKKMRRYFRLGGFIIALMASLYISNRAGAITIATVATSADHIQSTSMALDSQDYPHIAYRDFATPGLRHAFWDGTAWQTETVDTVGTSCGQSASLAIDASDNLHIGYRRDNDIRYATNSSGSWTYEFVDTNSGIPYVSLALTTAGSPRIAAYSTHLIYATRGPSNWTIEDIRYGENIYPSLAFDSSDNPFVAYQRSGEGLLCADKLGGSWASTSVHSGNVGRYASLAIADDGTRYIAYYDSYDLWLAIWNGSSWSYSVVDDGGPADNRVGQECSLALDSAGNPHISYWDYTAADLKYAFWTGSVWDISIIDGLTSSVGRYSSILVDPNGNPQFSYASFDPPGDLYWAGTWVVIPEPASGLGLLTLALLTFYRIRLK